MHEQVERSFSLTEKSIISISKSDEKNDKSAEFPFRSVIEENLRVETAFEKNSISLESMKTSFELNEEKNL